MKKTARIIFAILLFLGLLALTGIYLSNTSVPVLEPKGMIAQKEKELINTASLLMLIVVVPVFIFLAVFIWKYREGNSKAKYTPEWGDHLIAETVWWGVPFLIIVVLAVITYTSSHELDPYRPLESDNKPVVIQVVALDWKWLFLYPEQGIAAINYIQFPEQTPINFEITADAPMNSFWIPQLGGQIYAMPAMTTKLHLIANEPGTFRGASANISGKGFAGMTFNAVATSEEEFKKWIESVKSSSSPLTFEEYTRLVEPSEYQPVKTYVLTDSDLFHQILMKYEPVLQPDAKQPLERGSK